MSFNVKTLFNDTKDLPIAKHYNSWLRVCSALEKAGFNVFEAEAIIDLVNEARAKKTKKLLTSGDFMQLLASVEIAPRNDFTSRLVMKKFGAEYGLELNEHGVPCRRGTMPGNPGAGTTLVPLGTPACCNPHTELYWSM